MKLQRCANGHFYDGDKYPTCPHCQDAGLPGFKDDETVTQPLNRAPGAVTSAGGGFGGGVTMPVDGFGGYGGGDIAPANSFDGGVTMPVNSFDGGVTMPVNGFSGGETIPVTRPDSGAAPKDDEEKTIGILPPIINNKIKPSEPSGAGSEQNGPCVGWMVCIGGDHIGRDFRLFEGRNTIGRSEGNGIALTGDKSVSKETHAAIAYEPKNNKFFAVPGTSRSLAYVNGQVLLSITEMHKNDVIELGNARLMLIPCCDEEFSWGKFVQSKD